MTEQERQEALETFEDIILDYFAFQAAACTTQPDCRCGRHGRPSAHNLGRTQNKHEGPA